jgi:hypothetical protein
MEWHQIAVAFGHFKAAGEKLRRFTCSRSGRGETVLRNDTVCVMTLVVVGMAGTERRGVHVAKKKTAGRNSVRVSRS